MRKLKKEIWPYSTNLESSDDIAFAESWCRDNIGLRFREWYSYTIVQNRNVHIRKYSFKDSETLLVFKLKWKCKE